MRKVSRPRGPPEGRVLCCIGEHRTGEEKGLMAESPTDRDYAKVHIDSPHKSKASHTLKSGRVH